MNRRRFLGTLIGGIAGAAAVRTFPFRVFSFPSVIKPVRDYYSIEWPVVTRTWEYGSYLPEMVGTEWLLPFHPDFGMDIKIANPRRESYLKFLKSLPQNSSKKRSIQP